MRRKRRMKAILSWILTIVVLCGMGRVCAAEEAKQTDMEILKTYVDKAAYLPGETVQIGCVIQNRSDAGSTDINIEIFYLESKIWEMTQTVSLNTNEQKNVIVNWTAPETDFRGYLVRIGLPNGQSEVTAIDVSSDVRRYPRYGYSVDFFPGETAEESDKMIRELAQVYHINLVQYYDWMYRHDKNAPDGENTWKDMFGHTISGDVIKQRINAGHTYNQKAMAYQMSYMAREGYENYGVNRMWGLYSDPVDRNITYDPSDESSINNIDQYVFPLEGKPAPVLFAFNPFNIEWQQFMANQYVEAVNDFGFDGIQIDQMGDYWGKDVTYYDYEGNTVDLANSFAAFTNHAKEQLKINNEQKSIVTMNAVNGGENDYFSTSNIIKEADTDFAFSELWGNCSTYNDIKNFVNWQRLNDGGKTMVLAAYMNQYDIQGDTYYFENAQMKGVHANSDGEINYITGFDENGDKAELQINVPEDGYYTLVFHAANGTDTQASKNIYIDGTKYMEAFFDSTRNGSIPAAPDWSIYSYDASFTTPKTLHLTAGSHMLSIMQEDGNKGGDIRLHSVTLGTYDKNSVMLTNAAIAALGAMHIELGSGMATTSNSGGNYMDVSLLGNPYYPKAAKTMDSSLQKAIREHYQFITAYENLLYDKDVLPSDTGLQNIEIEGENISGDAKPGTIWFTIKNKGEQYSILHLINLTGETDADWRNVTEEPVQKSNMNVKYYLPQFKEATSVNLASPDSGCITQGLNFTEGKDAQGKYIEFVIPSLKYWDMVYVALEEGNNPVQIEAEDSILTNVNVANNHVGYTGTGFVDSYGEEGDSVTMDFYVDEEKTYNLQFKYTAAVSQNPYRDVYIDGRGYEKIIFETTADWENWNIVQYSVELRKGIHRLVLYTPSDDAGYLNLDCMQIVDN